MYRLAFCVSWNSQLFTVSINLHISYSLMEMQSILFTLLESFEFAFPGTPSKTENAYEYELQRAPVGLMAPVVKGKAAFGPSVPLKVKVRAA
jgi:hypothetical protein